MPSSAPRGLEPALPPLAAPDAGSARPGPREVRAAAARRSRSSSAACRSRQARVRAGARGAWSAARWLLATADPVARRARRGQAPRPERRAALQSEACEATDDALAGAQRARRAGGFAQRARDALDELLRSYADALRRAQGGAVGARLRGSRAASRATCCARRRGRRERYAARFDHIMVDELQDTNRVQLALIDLIASGNLFTVGDAQQSIYGFRHAEVELFESRGRRARDARRARGAADELPLARRDPRAAEHAPSRGRCGTASRPLRVGRVRRRPPTAPRVELFVVDKGADMGARRSRRAVADGGGPGARGARQGSDRRRASAVPARSSS